MSKVIKVNGRTVEYEYHGGISGETLVFLHPALAHKGYWVPLLAELHEHTCITINRAGRFQSEGPAFDNIEASAKWSEDAILAILEENKITTPVTLIGWSMGGTEALHLAAQNPTWIKKLVMLSSSDKWGFKPLAFSEEEYTQGKIAEGHELLTKEEKYIGGSLSLRDLAPLPSFETCAADWKACRDYDGTNAAAKVNVPTLLIWGHEDELGSHEANLRLANVFKDVVVNDIKNALHDAPSAFAGEVGSVIGKFVSNVVTV